MSKVPFIKMHGNGNDFVIIDLQATKLEFSGDQIAHICDRNYGIGCDQFVVIEPSEKADLKITFFNPDASESGACGNATRCVAFLYLQQHAKAECTIETESGVLSCTNMDNNTIKVNMGKAKSNWQDIPLSEEQNTDSLDLSVGEFSNPVAVNMGNPHAVFFTKDIDELQISETGFIVENHQLFPERTNVEFVEVVDKNNIRLRVWERGAGETLACGSGACAAVVASFRKQLTNNMVNVSLIGGDLSIEITEDGDVLMTGPVAVVYTGVLDLELFGSSK